MKRILVLVLILGLVGCGGVKEKTRGNEKQKDDNQALYTKGLKLENRNTELGANDRALNLYLKAAQQGYADAAWRIGVLYNNGWGVPKSDQMAITWFTLAAHLGHADVLYYIGNAYLKGRGVPKDAEIAKFWFKRAADAGDDEAAYRLRKLEKKQNEKP